MTHLRTYAQQKAALTRAAKKSKADGNGDHVRDECKRAVAEWESYVSPYTHGWPDDWSRWQRALDDAYPLQAAPRLEELSSKRNRGEDSGHQDL